MKTYTLNEVQYKLLGPIGTPGRDKFEQKLAAFLLYGVETEQEADGRWIAEVKDLPGVMVYGATQEQAIAKAHELAIKVEAENQE